MEIPQRVLAVKLRTAIDRAMRHPSARWRFQVWWLIECNPRGSTSSHVRHNLGAARRAWLVREQQRLDTRPTGTLVRISSLPPEEQAEWADYLRRKIEMVRKHEIPATKKTKGGPIKPQGEYTVGEKGEEVFVPASTIRGDAVPEKKG